MSADHHLIKVWVSILVLGFIQFASADKCIHLFTKSTYTTCMEILDWESLVAHKSVAEMNAVGKRLNDVVTLIDRGIRTTSSPTSNTSYSDEILKAILGTSNLTCSSEQMVQQIKHEIHQLKKQSYFCLLGNMWTVCQALHPRCVFNPPNASLSYVCREECRGTVEKPSCAALLKLYNKMKTECRIPSNRYVDNLVNCEKHPVSDMKHIERCQLYGCNRNSVTIGCYEGNGCTYKGRVNTAGGKKCDRWYKDPYLNYTYDRYNLDVNYCRNPQGIGEKPWCYTDIVKKVWSYCDVPRCDGHTHPVKRKGLSGYEVGTLVVLVALVVIGVPVCLYKRRRARIALQYQEQGNSKPDIGYVEA